MEGSPTKSDDSTGTDDTPQLEIPIRWYQRFSRGYGAVVILCFVNLLNYIDRYTIAGVLDNIQSYYGLSKTEQGLLQTTFIITYMILAPIFGYLGDRYSRKWLMCGGILFWSLTTLAGSFVPPNLAPVFFFIRGLVGVGEASYSTIAPTIISDLYIHKMRSRMLGAFYFAIPVGSGLGYIVGSSVAKAAGSWQWALRVTPPLGILCVFLIACFVHDPPRGRAEGGEQIIATSWMVDIRSLMTNWSFVSCTLGFTCVAFSAGALALWAPQFMMYSIRLHDNNPDFDQSSVSFIFGAITCVAGILGVGLGSFLSQKFRSTSIKADPLVCAIGMVATAPFLYTIIVISRYYPDLSWVLIFFAEAFLCLNWPIVGDICLYVVVPPRRSSAGAFNILMSHALGDAISPYIVGAISDAIKLKHPQEFDSDWNNWNSLQGALYITTFVCVLGGLFFIISSWFIEEDKKKVDKAVQEANTPKSTEDPNSDPWNSSFSAVSTSGSMATLLTNT